MNDSRIIELYFERSESAIDETAKAYGKLCYAVAYGVLSTHEDAEECVNDTYARVWNSIPPQKPRKLSAFLARITRNLALDVLAKKTADKRGGYLIAEELSDFSPRARISTTPSRRRLKAFCARGRQESVSFSSDGIFTANRSNRLPSITVKRRVISKRFFFGCGSF